MERQESKISSRVKKLQRVKIHENAKIEPGTNGKAIKSAE